MDTNKPETPKPTITREQFDEAYLAQTELACAYAVGASVEEDPLVLADTIRAYADQQDARFAELELVGEFDRSGHEIGVEFSRENEAEIAKLKERIKDLEESLTIAHMAGYEDGIDDARRAGADAIKSAESTGYGMAMQAASEHYAGKMSKAVAEKVKEKISHIYFHGMNVQDRVYAIIDSMTEEGK